MELPTTERLANALHKAGAPAHLVNQARLGHYDKYKSPLTFPKVQLIHDLRIANLHDFALRVIGGEFDSSAEEARAWSHLFQSRNHIA
jgi:hypothetical protein